MSTTDIRDGIVLYKNVHVHHHAKSAMHAIKLDQRLVDRMPPANKASHFTNCAPKLIDCENQPPQPLTTATPHAYTVSIATGNTLALA